MKSEPLVIQRQINSPADHVWKALTDPAQLEKWFFKFENFRPEAGFEFTILDDYPSSCKIIEAVKNKKLSYSLSFDQYPSATVVTFELFDEGETTQLRLSHEGLENIPAAGNVDFEREKFFKGWSNGLSSLQHYLEVLIYC